VTKTSNSIVSKRLLRNLRYKLTYIDIFESYKDPDPGPEVVALLDSLIEAQQSAIAPLSSYLRGLDVNTQDLELDQRLLSHASNRDNLKSRLRFVQDGLSRSVSWYKMQLTDRQMTADPELRHLLFELGEIDAARLWRVEAVMALLKISVKVGEKERDDVPQQEPQQKEEKWRPRLMDDVGRPAWGGSGSRRWPRPSRYRGTKDSGR
jgi:hypothetical protein